MQVDPAQLRICFIAGTLGRGGAERQLFYMLQVLTGLNAQCRVLSLTKGEPYEAKIAELGIPITWVGASPSRLRRLLRIAREVKQWRPHFVQSVHSYTNLYAVLAARCAGCMDIGAARSDGIREFTGLGLLSGPSLRWPTILAVNSRQAAEMVRTARGINKPLYFLPNVVDTDHFVPRLGAPSARCNTLLVLCVGTLKSEKRQDVFLYALARAKTFIPTLRASLVGDGPLRGALEKLARDLGIEDAVEFMGTLDDVKSVYQRGDMLVLTSDYEGAPNVILEAMACGLPVVSTRVGAASDFIVDGETGFLTDARDVEAIADRIVRLASEPELRRQMGSAARARVEAQYSLSLLRDNLLGLYDLAYQVGYLRGRGLRSGS